MELRNIQKTGGSSYTITVPKKWIEDNNLSEKDQLIVTSQKTGQLCFFPVKKSNKISSSLIVNNLTKEQIEREIIALYLSGADEIIIHGNAITSEQRAHIRSVSYRLIGLEIFDSNSSSITLKYVASLIIPIKEYIDRMYYMTSSMLEDIIPTLTENNRVLARDIIERDVEIDRIQMAITRQLNYGLVYQVMGGEDAISLPELQFYALTAIRLERIADHIVKIASSFLQLDPAETKIVTKYNIDRIKTIHNCLKTSNEMIRNLDKKRAHVLLDEIEAEHKECFINRSLKAKNSMQVLIEDSMERIISYIFNISEGLINYHQLRARVQLA